MYEISHMPGNKRGSVLLKFHFPAPLLPPLSPLFSLPSAAAGAEQEKRTELSCWQGPGTGTMGTQVWARCGERGHGPRVGGHRAAEGGLLLGGRMGMVGMGEEMSTASLGAAGLPPRDGGTMGYQRVGGKEVGGSRESSTGVPAGGRATHGSSGVPVSVPISIPIPFSVPVFVPVSLPLPPLLSLSPSTVPRAMQEPCSI